MNYQIDSRKVKKGDIFVAIKGIKIDGHDYIEQAIKNGATRVICENGLYPVDTMIVKDTKKYLAEILALKNKEILNKIKIIGITGTNGKTTTCFLLYQALNLLGIKTAYIGTIGFYINEKVRDLDNTTPDFYLMHELMEEANSHNCEYIVMEVSSHALSQDRLEGINFDYVMFTNLTQDHLDYHITMENYALSKQKLFYKVKNDGSCIVNIDDKYADYFLNFKNIVTVGFNQSDYKIMEYSIDMNETKFFLKNNQVSNEYSSCLIGKHNIYNLVFVISLLELIKIDKMKIIKIVKELKEPVGRMEQITYNDSKIIIDYAHTPDAVIKILNTVKELKVNKIYTVIGCGGDRDKTKRPIMGNYACQFSDFVIFTNDNPRNEDEDLIIEDMLSITEKDNYKIVKEREKAIKYGIQLLQNNDILLVLGKGHEEYQIIKNNKYYFSDKQTVLDIIRR